MKNVIYILSAFLFMSYCSYGQSLVITDSTTTPSVCFNDGSIAVAASGGSGTYSFSIISGPSYPNITYPILLPAHDSVFLTLPRGQYTIMVTDGAGDTAYATATVAGNYTFPAIVNYADTVYSTCITMSVQGGRPPYQFSRSSTGTNTGFGPYQSSSSFCNLCNGPNWIRVKDSCSNIFTTNKIYVEVPLPRYAINNHTVGRTDSVTVGVATAGAPPYTYHLSSGPISITNHTGIFPIPARCLPDTITVTDSCGRTFDTIIDLHPLQATVTSPCRSGIATITINPEAIAPYTITGTNGSLVTHQNQVTFSSLSVDSPYHFTIMDSCGNVATFLIPVCDTVPPDTFFFYPVCPFDSSLHMVHDPLPFCYPVVVTCLSCSPMQRDTIHSTPARLFTNIDTGITYTIRIQDSCGFNDTTKYTPTFAPLGLTYTIISCDDISVSSAPPSLTPPVHYSLFDQGVLIDSITADYTTFYHLPAGTYQVEGAQALCAAGSITIGLPILGGKCVVPMFDSTCTPSYAIIQYILASGYRDVYSLINTTTSASYRQLLPSPFADALVFYDVPVGNYNLVSDSGCSTPFVLPPFTNYTVSAVSTRQCTGAALIKAAYTPQIQSCNTSQSSYFVLLKDNQYIANSASGDFIVSDTGYYVVRLYMTNSSIFGIFSTEDTFCPLDTSLVYVNDVATPNLIAPLVEVCGNINADIPYTIFGGTPPYTVEILGHPTQTVNSTSDTFPGVSPGTYTMVVYDSCGISGSFSVAVIDTCGPACAVVSGFSLSDTITCTHAAVSMQNLSTGATHYRWYINGSLYAYGTDTSFIPPTGGSYTITLYAYIGSCTDSTRRTIVAEDTLHGSGRMDTALCPPLALRLNSHLAGTVWSTGATDSVITVTAPGLYQASFTNLCGSAIDTVNVATYPEIDGFNLTDDKSTLCERAPDSVIVIASIDSTGQSAITFRWSTGARDTAAYSSTVTIYQAGSYTVTAEGGCPLIKDISIDTIACDSECIKGLAIPDIFTPNGDGRNDTFFIPHICDLYPFAMHIYNRWGELVFESPDINRGWDGTYRGSPEPEEIYWLWLMMTLPDGRVIYRTGPVTLVR